MVFLNNFFFSTCGARNGGSKRGFFKAYAVYDNGNFIIKKEYFHDKI